MRQMIGLIRVLSGGLVAAGCVLTGPGPAAVPVGVAVSAVRADGPDLPAGAWLAFGDSITASAFLGLGGWTQAFDPGPSPMVRNAGIPGATAHTALLRLAEVLAANPDAARVGLAFGTNDAYSAIVAPDLFAARMRAVVEQVEVAGRRPMLATIPWSPLAQMAILPAYNEALGAIAADHQLPPGPDLYAWFAAHPDELGADGIHPTAAGSASIRRLWGAALRVGFKTGG